MYISFYFYMLVVQQNRLDIFFCRCISKKFEPTFLGKSLFTYYMYFVAILEAYEPEYDLLKKTRFVHCINLDPDSIYIYIFY